MTGLAMGRKLMLWMMMTLAEIPQCCLAKFPASGDMGDVRALTLGP